MTEIEKNFRKSFESTHSDSEDIFQRLEKICEGLTYISEIDSPVTTFVGRRTAEGNWSDLLTQTGSAPGDSVREVDFGLFFDRLTAWKDWHEERHTVRAKKFLDLRKLIEENLTEPKVYKIGEPNVRIVAAGLEPDGRAVGITMKALET